MRPAGLARFLVRVAHRTLVESLYLLTAPMTAVHLHNRVELTRYAIKQGLDQDT